MKQLLSSVAVAGLLVGLGGIAPALAIDPSRIENADKNPNDWLTYHGSYKSWHYSGLDQINADNVKNLQVAWINSPGRKPRGVKIPLERTIACRPAGIGQLQEIGHWEADLLIFKRAHGKANVTSLVEVTVAPSSSVTRILRGVTGSMLTDVDAGHQQRAAGSSRPRSR
jgi:hypothetical protein